MILIDNNNLLIFNVSGENSVNRGTAENGIPGSTNNTNTGKANYQKFFLLLQNT